MEKIVLLYYLKKNPPDIQVLHDTSVRCIRWIQHNEARSFWDVCTNQSKMTSFIYKKLILSVEETTSGGRCGFSFVTFLHPASACLSDRVSQGAFLFSERSPSTWVWNTFAPSAGHLWDIRACAGSVNLRRSEKQFLPGHQSRLRKNRIGWSRASNGWRIWKTPYGTFNKNLRQLLPGYRF